MAEQQLPEDLTTDSVNVVDTSDTATISTKKTTWRKKRTRDEQMATLQSKRWNSRPLGRRPDEGASSSSGHTTPVLSTSLPSPQSDLQLPSTSNSTDVGLNSSLLLAQAQSDSSCSEVCNSININTTIKIQLNYGAT